MSGKKAKAAAKPRGKPETTAQAVAQSLKTGKPVVPNPGAKPGPSKLHPSQEKEVRRLAADEAAKLLNGATPSLLAVAKEQAGGVVRGHGGSLVKFILKLAEEGQDILEMTGGDKSNFSEALRLGLEAQEKRELRAIEESKREAAKTAPASAPAKAARKTAAKPRSKKS